MNLLQLGLERHDGQEVQELASIQSIRFRDSFAE
jgi:hypothetical protein